MREFPGTISAKERWPLIAKYVEGKNAKACFERFKEIVALVKKQQEGGAGAAGASKTK